MRALADIAGMSVFHTAVLASLVLTTPLLLVTSLKNLSWLNLVGCMSTALVTLMVVGSVALDPDRSRQPIQVTLPLMCACSRINRVVQPSAVQFLHFNNSACLIRCAPRAASSWV